MFPLYLCVELSDVMYSKCTWCALESRVGESLADLLFIVQNFFRGPKDC